MEGNANAIYLVLKNEIGKQIKNFQDADFYLTGLMRSKIIIPSKTIPSLSQPPKPALALNVPKTRLTVTGPRIHSTAKKK